jgi:hypothetical protein
MKTLKNAPYLMTVIINIQTMNKKINVLYNSDKDFKRLEKMTEDQLHEEQNNLVPLYNNFVTAQILKDKLD